MDKNIERPTTYCIHITTDTMSDKSTVADVKEIQNLSKKGRTPAMATQFITATAPHPAPGSHDVLAKRLHLQRPSRQVAVP